METRKVSDGNGGFVQVAPDAAVILTHLGYMKNNLADIDTKVSALSTEVTEIKEDLIRVQSDTNNNTLLRRWVGRSLVGSLVGASVTFTAWLCGLFTKGG